MCKQLNMLPRNLFKSRSEEESRNMSDSERDYSVSNLCSSTLNTFKIDANNRIKVPEMNEKPKHRRSYPSPTPVQSNPIFQQQYGKRPIRQRRGSFLYKQESSSNIGDVISPNHPAVKPISASTNEDFIITPFAQILAKLRFTYSFKSACID